MVEPVIVEHHKLEKVLGQHFAEESSFDFNDEEFDLDVSLDGPTTQEDEEETPQGDEAPMLNILISCSLMPFVWALQTYILNRMKSHIGYVIESTVCYVKLPIHLYNWQTVWRHV